MADKQENTGLSRRDFLKVATMATAGALLAGCEWEKGVESEKKPTYREINKGDKLPLTISGDNNMQDVAIDYRVSNESFLGKLQVRMEDGKIIYPIPFEVGALRTRKVGECLGVDITKLKKNDSLPKETTVGYYPNPELPINSLDRNDFPESGNIYGLKVIVAPRDYLGDGNNPLEVNSNTNKYDAGVGDHEKNLDNFGEGWAIGTYNSETKNFTVLGYVGDSRALVEDK